MNWGVSDDLPLMFSGLRLTNSPSSDYESIRCVCPEQVSKVSDGCTVLTTAREAHDAHRQPSGWFNTR